MIALQIEREKRRWSKRELARRAGIDAAILSYAENRHFLPYPKQVEGIAAALDWQGDPAELFEEVTEDGTANI